MCRDYGVPSRDENGDGLNQWGKSDRQVFAVLLLHRDGTQRRTQGVEAGQMGVESCTASVTNSRESILGMVPGCRHRPARYSLRCLLFVLHALRASMPLAAMPLLGALPRVL